MGNECFVRVSEFKYLGSILREDNILREEYGQSDNACYFSVSKLLSSQFLSRNLKIRIYRSIILPVVPYGCGAWSFTLGDEKKFRVFENRILRRICA